MTSGPGAVSRRAWRVWQRNAQVARTTWLINVLPPLLEPVLYILAFGLGMGSLIGVVVYQGRDIPYLDFMVPGVITVAVMFWAFFETTFSSFVRMYYQNTFDAILATPLTVEDIIVGEWLWGATKSLFAATLMLLMVSMFGIIAWPSALLVIPIATLGGLLFAAIGLICTALTPNIDSFNLPMFVAIFPMFLFSGTFFPVDILPSWAYALAMGLPLTHISFLIRGACLGEIPPHAIWSILYLVFGTALLAGDRKYPTTKDCPMQMTAQAAAATRDQLLMKLDMEQKAFMSVIKELPEDKLSYTPHEKVRPFGELAHHISTTGAWFADVMEKGEMQMGGQAPATPTSKAALLDSANKMHEFVVGKVKALSAEQLSKEITFATMGAFPAVTFLDWHNSHLIHHRGQLTTYLRTMGAKVPQIYGGSADYPMKM
jgi:lipooligosaccharide transport system permease protein